MNNFAAHASSARFFIPARTASPSSSTNVNLFDIVSETWEWIHGPHL
jgi:hypothetical protein